MSYKNRDGEFVGETARTYLTRVLANATYELQSENYAGVVDELELVIGQLLPFVVNCDEDDDECWIKVNNAETCYGCPKMGLR